MTEIKPNDPVFRPAHYTDGAIEVIDYIEDKKLGFCLGNAVKYISRAGKKDPSKEIEDLKKRNGIYAGESTSSRRGKKCNISYWIMKKGRLISLKTV